MSASAIADRAKEKRRAILAFLASGERCTSVKVVQMILGNCDRQAASRSLHALKRDGFVVPDKINLLLPTLWGITAEGLALAGVEGQPFRAGRLKPSHIPHRLDLQCSRLRAEAQGWSSWVPTSRLMAPVKGGATKKRKEKIPDSLVKSPPPRGIVVAVEMEITIKSKSRYQDILGRHVQMFEEGKYELVHYLVPNGLHQVLALKLADIKNIRVRGALVPFEDKYRRRITCHALSDWPPPAKQKETE